MCLARGSGGLLPGSWRGRGTAWSQALGVRGDVFVLSVGLVLGLRVVLEGENGPGLVPQRVHVALCCETDKTTPGNKHRRWVTAPAQVSAGWLGYSALELIQGRCLWLGFHHRGVGRGELESGLFFCLGITFQTL